MSYNQLVERKSIKQIRERREKLLASKNEVIETKKEEERKGRLDYVPFVNVGIKDMKNEDMSKDLLGKTNGAFVPQRALVDPVTGKTWSFTYPSKVVPPDLAMFNLLNKEESWVEPFLAECQSTYSSNGSKTGLVKRMGSRIKNFVKIWSVSVMDRIYLNKHLPVNNSNYVFETRLNDDSPCIQRMNVKADAGLPYAFYAEKGVVPKVQDDYQDGLLIDHAIKDANLILSELEKPVDDKDVIVHMFQFFSKRRDLSTAMLKRKFENMPREEYWEKVRPYVVMPLALRLVFKYAIHPIEENLLNFQQNSDSNSAYHYSPFYGGASSMVDWAVDGGGCIDKEGVGFKAMSYGDDQQWMFYIKGEYVRLHPDIKSMDLCTSSAAAVEDIKYLLNKFKNAPKTWKRAVMLLCVMAYTHDLHINGSYILRKLTGLCSGVPGTTIFNIIHSTLIQAKVDRYVRNHSAEINIGNILQHIARILDMIKKEMGYVMKDMEGFSFDVANMEKGEVYEKYHEFIFKGKIAELHKDGVPLPFLGSTIVHKEVGDLTGLVAQPLKMFKFSNSLVCPKSQFGGLGAVRNRLERILGIYMSGAWLHKEFGEFLRSTYKELAKQISSTWKLSPDELGVLGQEDIEELVKDDEFIRMINLRLPSEIEMLNFNTLDKEKFVESSKFHIEALVVAQQEETVVQLPDFNPSFLDELNIDELPNTNIEKSKMNQSNANTILEDKIKIARRKRLAEARAIRFAIKSIRHRGSNYTNDETLTELEDNFDAYVESVDEGGSLDEDEYDEVERLNALAREHMKKYFDEYFMIEGDDTDMDFYFYNYLANDNEFDDGMGNIDQYGD